MKVAYFDCQFGAAGDMLCASLLANGLNAEDWIEELKKIALPPDSFEIEIEDVMRCLIASKKMTVKCVDTSGDQTKSASRGSHDIHNLNDEQDDDHFHKDHSVEHSHEHSHVDGGGDCPEQEHSHSHDHAHAHSHDHEHAHDHSHSQDAHAHDHCHDSEHEHGRSIKEIVQIIESSKIADRAKELSLAIFWNLAESEARVHNVSPADVHFHEVGAVDAIVDVVGFSIGYHLLGIEKSVVSPLTLGGGTIKTDHGIYPVPAPAVAYLVQRAGAPTSSLNIPYECLTPTGAAILTTIAESWGTQPAYQKIDSVGYGAGTLNPKSHPNTVRMFVGQCSEIRKSTASEPFNSTLGSQVSSHVFDDNGTQFRAEIVTVIEATIDDCPPNIIAYALEKALAEGALDIAIVPVTMKKGRSGHLITVLAKPQDRRKLETLLLRETSTLGVRTYFVERLIAEREFAEVKLSESWSIRIKIGRDLNGNVINIQPEYEDCAAYAQRHDVPLREVFEQALATYNKEQPDTEASTRNEPN